MTWRYDAAYQGTRGANSEDAAIDLLSKDARLLPRDTLEDLFNSVADGQVFRKHPQIQPVPDYHTAGAVARAMREGLTDATSVGTRRAAEVYGGVILGQSIQDHSENYTRFLLITPSNSPGPERPHTND